MGNVVLDIPQRLPQWVTGCSVETLAPQTAKIIAELKMLVVHKQEHR
jgi:hypothetical protein